MTPLLQKLPTLLVLAVLVSIFVSLQRHVRSARVRMWTLAWGLVFLHFLVQVFEAQPGLAGQVAAAINVVCLQLSGVVFLVSLTTTVERDTLRWGLLALLGLPITIYAVGISAGTDLPWLYIACVLIAMIGGCAWLLQFRERASAFAGVVVVLLLSVGVWSIYHAANHRYGPGLSAALTF